MPVRTSKTIIILSLLVGVLAVSTASIFIRLAQGEVDALAIAAYRLTLATLLLMPVVLFRYRLELLKIYGQILWKIILAGFLLAVHFAAWITSLQFTSVTSSVVLVTTTPLWVTIFGFLILKEKVSRFVILGLVVALTGSIVVGLSSEFVHWGTGASSESNIFGYGTTSIWGNFLALIGAWAASGYILAGRKVRPHISLPVYTFLVYGISAIFLIAAVFVTGTKMTGFNNLTYVWLLFLAVIPQLIGHSTFNWALRYIPASVVSIALLGEPVGSTVLAIFFLKENPTLIEIGGGILILAGIYISSRESNRNMKSS